MDRMGLRGLVEELAALERGSASPGERAAALLVARRLREAGLEPRIEEERAHGTYTLPIAALNALALLGALRGRRWPALAALALLGDDLDHRRRLFRRLALPRRTTWNVTAEAGDPSAPRTVVVVAHHDAAHGGAIFDTRLIEAFARRFPERFARVTRWPPVMWGVVLGPAFLAVGARRLGALFALGTLAAMADIARTPVVPGANDNASAVAALVALARRAHPGVRVLLVSTGAEESNAEGMQAWGRRHFPALAPGATSFVALETLGSGRLAIPEAEGFLFAHAYTPALKDLATREAERLGLSVRRGLSNSFASDAQIPLHAGYPTMLLAAIDALSLPANYHKPWDTPDRLDYGSVADAVELLTAVIAAHA
jgi:Peptidase family M28